MWLLRDQRVPLALCARLSLRSTKRLQFILCRLSHSPLRFESLILPPVAAEVLQSCLLFRVVGIDLPVDEEFPKRLHTVMQQRINNLMDRFSFNRFDLEKPADVGRPGCRPTRSEFETYSVRHAVLLLVIVSTDQTLAELLNHHVGLIRSDERELPGCSVLILTFV